MQFDLIKLFKIFCNLIATAFENNLVSVFTKEIGSQS